MGRSQLDCRCGQRFRREGMHAVAPGQEDKNGFVNRNGYVIYACKDPKPGYASYVCDGCGAKREQKLRIPKPKEV